MVKVDRCAVRTLWVKDDNEDNVITAVVESDGKVKIKTNHAKGGGIEGIDTAQELLGAIIDKLEDVQNEIAGAEDG